MGYLDKRFYADYKINVFYETKSVQVTYNNTSSTFIDVDSITLLTENIIEWREGYKNFILESPFINLTCPELILGDYKEIYIDPFLKCLAQIAKDNAYLYLYNILLVAYFGNKEHMIDLKKGNYFVFEFFPTYHTSVGTYVTRMVQIFKHDEYAEYSLSKGQAELRNKSQNFSFCAKITDNTLMITRE